MTKIYLISPPKIELESFSKRLESVLQTGLVPVFQLRLKGYEEGEIKEISKVLIEICHKNNCLFLLNDNLEVALEVEADGVHLGVDDGFIAQARKEAPENFIIGASCYDSKHLAIEAAEQGADYISFGAFFESKTKKSRGNPEPEIITWADEILNVPIVTIGGINSDNCGILVKAGADFISIISYIWDNKKDEVEAVKELYDVIKNSI